MKQVVVGTYGIGSEQVQIVLREGTGAEFWFVPEHDRVPRIKIGADQATWREIVSGLLHEAMEMMMDRARCRFDPAGDLARDHSSYLFVMNHPQFSDVVARVADLQAACLPELAAAWNKWRRPKRR